jgi:hypothetical protein
MICIAMRIRVTFRLVSFGLVWFGLVWFGLSWFGLVWFGLVWFGKCEEGVWEKTTCEDSWEDLNTTLGMRIVFERVPDEPCECGRDFPNE